MSDDNMDAIQRLQEAARRKKRAKRTKNNEPHTTTKKKSGGGKKSSRKGGKYELRIAKKFRKWYGGTVEKTPRSGGWTSAEEFGLKADIVFKCKRAKYHIECKNQEGWLLTDLITGKRSADTTSTHSIEKWWEQALRGCPEKKCPMLIFTRNHQPDFLMVYTSDMDRVLARTSKGWWAFLPHFRVQQDGHPERVVLELDNFLKFVKPPKYAPNRKLWKRGEL